ncbi:hypothetical protein [Verminephrobacter aporrectodeae]|uniref:hypothetical protein n=1 Tax=Verminephrobacter aporrectodeae TaxID=1110389 RepID=UPI0022434C30|nr:hypothetical protein [Verminephrobacter aporrectodeae]
MKVRSVDAHGEAQGEVHIHLACGHDELLHRPIQLAVFLDSFENLLVNLLG